MSRSARDYKKLLASGRWFAGLPPALQERLVEAAALRRLVAGERLFSRGDAPSGLYAVVDGAIRVRGLADGGREALLTLLEPPSWFGEIAVFDRQPRTHDAIADVESLVLHVPQPALDAMLAAEPAWWRELGLLVTAKLRLAFVAMEELAVVPTPTRLARRLLWMAEGYGERPAHRTVEASQEQLALMVATSRQTANAILKDLESRGVIRIGYGSIEIVDFEALRAAAG